MFATIKKWKKKKSNNGILKVFYDRAILLQLRERSHVWLFFSPYKLELYTQSEHAMLTRRSAGPRQGALLRTTGWSGGAADGEELTEGSGAWLATEGFTLPILPFANVQSVENKVDELHDRISMQKDIQDCSIGLLCFCETWLGERRPDKAITPDGYTVFREDRFAAEERPHLSKNPGVPTVRSYQRSCSEISDFEAKTIWPENCNTSLWVCI